MDRPNVLIAETDGLPSWLEEWLAQPAIPGGGMRWAYTIPNQLADGKVDRVSHPSGELRRWLESDRGLMRQATGKGSHEHFQSASSANNVQAG